jgi:hypothetical protein
MIAQTLKIHPNVYGELSWTILGLVTVNENRAFRALLDLETVTYSVLMVLGTTFDICNLIQSTVKPDQFEGYIMMDTWV